MRKNVIGFVVGSQINATTIFPTSDSLTSDLWHYFGVWSFIPDFLLVVSDFRLRTSHLRLQTLNFVYSILEFRVFISDYSLLISRLPSSVFGFRTFYFGVRTFIFNFPFFGILISNVYLGFRTRNFNSDHWRIIFYLPAWHFSWNDDLRLLSLLRLICDGELLKFDCHSSLASCTLWSLIIGLPFFQFRLRSAICNVH